MNFNGMVVAENNVAETFAKFFDEKVSNIVSGSVIDQNVYNGRSKMASVNTNFMFRPALGCAQHPKAGGNTQQGSIKFLLRL